MDMHDVHFLLLKDLAHLKAREFNTYISIDMTVECYKQDDPETKFRVFRSDHGSRTFRRIENAIRYVESMEKLEDE